MVGGGFSNGLPNSPCTEQKYACAAAILLPPCPKGVIEGVDFQHTGKVRSVDKTGLISVLATGAIGLIRPGIFRHGEILI